MELEGNVWKEGRFWYSEVPSLDLMTQGKSRADALDMILDAIISLIEDAFENKVSSDFELSLHEYDKNIFGIEANAPQLLLALALRRQRAKSGLTIREVALRLGSSSPNAYARYEQASLTPSINKFDQLLRAVAPTRRGILVR